MHLFKTALAAAAIAVGGGAASAATFNIVSTVGDLGVTGSIMIDLSGDQTGIGADEYRFDVTVTNNDDAAYATSTITAFYLLSDPNSSLVSETSTRYDPGTSTTLPPFATVYDFCLESDTNLNCTGGNPSDGLGEGESESFTIVVSAVSEPTFTGAAMRWQQTDGNEGSAKGEVCPTTNPDCFPGGGPEVPLPAGLPLLATGLFVVGYMKRRHKSA